MDISEEIDGAMIATDEAKILESKSDVRVAILIKFDDVNGAKTVKKPDKDCLLHVQSFCFAYFPVFVVVVVVLSSLVSWLGALPRKTVLAMRRFRLKIGRGFDEKHATKLSSTCRNPSWGSIFNNTSVESKIEYISSCRHVFSNHENT